MPHWYLQGVMDEKLIQVQPEPAIILQIWIRDHVTKLLLDGMFEIVQTLQHGIVTRAPLEVS